MVSVWHTESEDTMGNARGLGGSFPGSTLSFLKVTEMIKEIKAFPLENRLKKMRHWAGKGRAR